MYQKSRDLIVLSGSTDQNTVGKKVKFILVMDIICNPKNHCPIYRV